MITLGPAFKKVLNGFVWQRDSVEVEPTYVIAAQLEVYGGPFYRSSLMERPNIEGYAYNGYVNLANQDAIDHMGVWAQRKYINLKIQGVIYSDPDKGNILASGYIGYTGMYQNSPYDGTSVSWMIRANEGDTGATLLIYPTVGISGVMRGFGTTETTLAPWNAYGEYAYLSERITSVETSKKIICNGSLEAMFAGCSNIESMDLSSFEFIGSEPGVLGSGTTSMREREPFSPSLSSESERDSSPWSLR